MSTPDVFFAPCDGCKFRRQIVQTIEVQIQGRPTSRQHYCAGCWAQLAGKVRASR